MNHILSILIATTPDRNRMFTSLCNELYRQILYMNSFHDSLGSIEVVVDGSKRFLDGGLSIGKKREALVQAANGKYLCFLDSDENIAPNYLETLVRLCNQDKDICTFRSLGKLENYWALYDMSIENTNQESTPNTIVLRNGWHVCPVKTEYAKLYKFEDISYGEDFIWMHEVLKHCKTEAHTDAILLQYNHSSKFSEADRITRYELDKKPI